MTLLQRFGYYLGGFSIGLIILAFFLNGKKASCSYGPDARVLKNIHSKEMIYSDDVQLFMNTHHLDTSAVNDVLRKGDVNFSKSDTHKKPCAIYTIEGDYNEKNLILSIENCDSIATLLNMSIKE
ncbi:DUF4258 domain-containing protein [Confluentibacter sediminis]|uniref:DUF4258 domain-containing protein n=1 Tax=Confluentibacter sediminis TaxID=2219045 RepID=UPI000DAD0C96|nr:DUF4258 domain-containing protein [Confluentibacter sediminis]